MMKYIGETSRTLAERSVEHVSAASKLDADNFIVKHWVSQHRDSIKPPRIRFAVKKSFQDPMTRLVTEAVLIDKESNLNSKAEWGHNKLKRLIVDKPTWMYEAAEVKEDKDLLKKVDALREMLESQRKVLSTSEY